MGIIINVTAVVLGRGKFPAVLWGFSFIPERQAEIQ